MCKRKKCNDIAFDTGKFIIFYMSPLWLFVIWCPFRLNHCICIMRNEGIPNHQQTRMFQNVKVFVLGLNRYLTINMY